MAVNNEKNRSTVPTRLGFYAGDALNESLLAFVRPDLRHELKVRQRPFRLFSDQVAQLFLYSSTQSSQDVVDVDKYENAVGTVMHSDINLQPHAEVNASDPRFLEIRTALFLQADRALRVLAQPPLFPKGYKGDITIYTRIPRGSTAPLAEIGIAERDLHLQMGERIAGATMAPWKMSVKGASVIKEWKKPDIIIHNHQRAS